MTNRIYLAGIVEQGGRVLLIRPTPQAQWELPGGPLLQRHADADVAMNEILETFGFSVPSVSDGFLETIYLPDGEGHIVFNLYHAAEWTGEAEIPIGMGAGWFAFDELDAIEMRDEVRNAVLVAYGLREPVNQDAAILQAMSGAATDPNAVQPPLVPVPPFEALPDDGAPAARTSSVWSRPGMRAERTPVEEPAETPGDGPMEEAASDGAQLADAADVPAEPPVDAVTGAEPAPEGPEDPESESNLLQFPVFSGDASEPQDFGIEADEPGVEDDEDGAAVEDPELGAVAVDGEIPAVDNIIDFEIGAAAIEAQSEDVLSPADLEQALTAGDEEPLVEMAEQLSRRLRGLDVLRTLRGGNVDPVGAHEQMRAGTPEIADDVVDFALGEVWATSRLDRKTRSLQVVAMLSALGGRQGPLRSHMNGALNHGATPDELVETLRMVAVYAGFPAALEAWPVLEDVFRTRGVKPEGRA